jgi:hypothetical protein
VGVTERERVRNVGRSKEKRKRENKMGVIER